MEYPSYLSLEQEIAKFARAMTSRDLRIGKDLLTDLKSQLALEEVAGIVIVSLERLMRLDAQAFIWAVENLIPADVMQEIQRLITVNLCQGLIGKEFTLGEDFSIDAQGRLLLNAKAQAAMFWS